MDGWKLMVSVALVSLGRSHGFFLLSFFSFTIQDFTFVRARWPVLPSSIGLGSEERHWLAICSQPFFYNFLFFGGDDGRTAEEMVAFMQIYGFR